MSYRGEDLDLRTPQGRIPRDGQSATEMGLNGSRQRAPAAAGGRGDSIYVDETVLACCNHAFGIAQAHGASEVRLEHLVHALTRVEAAASVLEERGIREAHLRRESAAVIASEIPVGLAHSHAAPRSSSELADVLARASELAQRRGVAASVHELLWVLLNYDRDIPAIGLLLRHATDWQSWDWPHQAEQRREAPRSPYYGERKPYAEPAPPPPRQRAPESVPPPQTYAAPVSYAPTLDPNVGNRLEQMDMALRKLQGDMASDRRLMTDMLRDIQRDVVAQRDSAGSSAMPTTLVNRLHDIETTFDRRFQDFGRTASTLMDRLQSIEKSVAGQSSAGIADLITDQLIAVTSQIQSATDRLKALEDGLASRRQSDTELRTLIERGAASGSGVGLQGLQTLLNERFQAVRQTLDQQNIAMASVVAQVTDPLSDRLRQLETQITTLNQRSGETAQGDRVAGERLGRIEQTLATAAQTIAQTGQSAVDLHERVKRLEAQASAQASANAQHAQSVAQGVQAITAKMTQVEALVQSHGDRSVKYAQQLAQQAAETQQRELTQLHEQLVTLGGNQRTLAESLDQWRSDNEGGLSIVANRIELLERTAGQPNAMLKQIQTDLQGLQQVTLADYDQNRKGIRNWLFGTEEVFASSWRDETRQIRERLKQMREERKV